jgi:phosphoribosylamine--glycine ligase
VIEFNARFGDPEAMNVLSLLTSDFVEICSKMAHGGIGQGDATFVPEASVCKYVVPEGYGTKSLADQEIVVDERAVEREGALLYYASVNEKDGRIFTTSSRSIGVVALSESIAEAERMVERGISHITGRIHVRHDIAKREMLEAKARRMENIRKGAL